MLPLYPFDSAVSTSDVFASVIDLVHMAERDIGPSSSQIT